MPDLTTTERARWYPKQPPMLPGEDEAAYTNRLTGADRTGRVPYDHDRNRQCSIGWHMECSDRSNLGATIKADGCGCPCHEDRMFAQARARAWNEANPAGTRVHLPQAPDEPPVATESAAYVGDHPGFLSGVAVVDLPGWPHPVALAWLEAVPS